MSKRTVTPQEMEGFARALHEVRARRELSREAFRQLHGAFVATDYAGQRWSVGLDTARWSVLRDGQWVPAEPPERLHLDEQVIAEIASRAGGAGARRCPKCGAALAEGETFCPRDGTPVPPAGAASAPARAAATPPSTGSPAPPLAATATAGGASPSDGVRSAPSPAVDRMPALLCVAIALAFAAGAVVRAATGAWVLAGVFVVLAVVCASLSRTPRRA